MVEEVVIKKGSRSGESYKRDDKRQLIPSNQQYKETLKVLSEKGFTNTLVAVRMGCEMGMSRLEIVNAEVRNVDREHIRGLYVDVAKKVRRNDKFVMRSREIPINSDLYQLLKIYIEKDNKYILKRERKTDLMKPLKPLHINYLYEQGNIPWSTHKSRHYFKNRIMDWMRQNRQVDQGLIKELMGHKKTITEDYGSISWDYKIEVIDKVFD